METKDMMKYVSIIAVLATVGMFAYVGYASNMISYLSEDPAVCINCHTMNTQFATWQHSSHRGRASCVECHLPRESLVDKIFAKSRDGFKHSVAMTFRTYEGQNIRASESAKKRIQANCIRCHSELVSQITANSKLYETKGVSFGRDRMCWGCHRDVPHGRARGLNATPDNLGVKNI
ncbi:MAG: cytochrome c nitrite reductase small subunit [Desulfobulbaceae bacterium]|jgi:cytochrome c nitrite reductase small subunit|nr:cytochrome c nitrite reductase small subunit [Desulfobulbaceae bacterium]